MPHAEPRIHLPQVIAALVALLLSAGSACGQTPAKDQATDPGYLFIEGLLSEQRKERRKASRALVKRDDPGLAFGIVDALFFIPKQTRNEAFSTLEKLTGAKIKDSYWPWVEEMGRLGETTRPAPGYMEWKTALLSKIDQRYRQVFYQGAPAHIRLEEVVNGGVRLNGIPSLDDPRMVKAEQAIYLRPDEAVFGVELAGEKRAYPLRILDWHEMLNDVIGGEPVTLSYCTLCGSGVLFSTRTPNGGAYRFGTSGLLYRSNKLMYDRDSLTLWSNLTGEPVIGRLARGNRQLEILPMTRTSWGEWSTRHPDTLVVELDDQLVRQGRDHGFDYRPGRADQARRGVSFPVWKRSQELPQDAEVFVIRLAGAVKAYPLELLFKHPSGLVNDEIGGVAIVLIADSESGAIRAYRRAGQVSKVEGDVLIGAGGERWRVLETALLAEDAASAELERLPGHLAFWFGWYAFFPQTEIWRGSIASAD